MMHEAIILVAYWDVMDIFDDVNDAPQYFANLLLAICKEHIPNKEITICPRNMPCMTLAAKTAIKNKAHNKWKKKRTPRNELLHNNVRHKVNVFLF